MKKNKVVPLRNGQEATSSREPSNQDAEKFFEQMLEGYEKYGRGTKRNTLESVAANLRAAKRLAEHTGKYPWEWKLEHWDDWNTNLVATRGISAATQRKYQGSIRSFLKYLTTREVYQREAKQKFGAEITQIIDEDEALHHIYEREQKKPRPAFTPELCDQFFNALKSEIKIHAAHPSRVLLNLQRDLALFYTMKVTGLRVGSVLALNAHSFGPNPKAPEMGNFGALYTTGKGSKGSGPKPIDTLIDDIKLPPLLEWYIKKIRLAFMKPNNPDEQALFLSERGRRLSYASTWVRMQKILESAGLANLGLCCHSFRHGKASEGGMRYGVETTRRMLGHTYGTTTQGYMAIPDEYAQKIINEHIHEQVTRAAKKDMDNEK